MLIGLPPFLIIRFVPFYLLMEMWSTKSIPAIYHCRRECHFEKNPQNFFRKFFPQYTTAHKNAVLTKKRKFYPNIYLPTIPPRKKIRFCRKFSKKFVPLVYSPRKKSSFWKKFAKILVKNFILTLHSRERQKFKGF